MKEVADQVVDAAYVEQVETNLKNGKKNNKSATPAGSQVNARDRILLTPDQLHQRLGELIDITDRLALDQALKRLSREGGVDKTKLEKQLRDLQASQQSRADAYVPEPSDATNRAAQELAVGDIFSVFQQDLKELGYVANDSFSASLLIAHGARLLDKSSGFIFYGSSSSGKSDGILKASAMLPPECVLNLTSITQQALFYIGDIKSKFLIFGEVAPLKPGEDDAIQKAWRQLLSEGKLTLLSVERNESGKNANEWRYTEGPCVVVATTTTEQNDWNDEFANRQSWVRSDDSQKTTDTVLELIGSRAEAPYSVPDVGGIVSKWHLFHRSLDVLPVIIPFARMVKPKLQHVTARRLFPLILLYTRVSALICQGRRERKLHDGKEYLIASVEDYQRAYDLVTENAPRVLDAVSPRAKDALDKVPDFREKWLTTGEIVAALRQPKTSVQRWLNELENSGLVVRGNKSGRQNTYQAVNALAADQVALGLIDPTTIAPTDDDRFNDEEIPF
jgi:DNA-binding transcriptional ArsR family regulator